MTQNLENLGFQYRKYNNGEVAIFRHNRIVTILRRKKAASFAQKILNMDTAQQQLLMARITGNYKRGNEV